jgi:hypothetical protein
MKPWDIIGWLVIIALLVLVWIYRAAIAAKLGGVSGIPAFIGGAQAALIKGTSPAPIGTGDTSLIPGCVIVPGLPTPLGCGETPPSR